MKRRPPVEATPVEGGRVGLSMRRSCAYVMLTRKQALTLAFDILKAAVEW